MAAPTTLFTSNVASDPAAMALGASNLVVTPFSLAANSTLTGIDLTMNGTPTSVKWAIQNDANGGVLYSGVSQVSKSDTSYRFTLPDVDLAGGTYWLRLYASSALFGNASVASLSSGAYNQLKPPVKGVGTLDYRINGQVQDVGEVPEPASFALAGLALVGAGVASRRRKVSGD